VRELELAFSANLSVAQADDLRNNLDRVRDTACSGIA
jgi:hypothetical protein